MFRHNSADSRIVTNNHSCSAVVTHARGHVLCSVPGTGQFKCDGTRAETRFRLSAKRTSPFNRPVGVSSVAYWQPSCAHEQ